MSSLEVLVALVRSLDRTTLGCIDDCPPETAWIDFVAPPEVAELDGGKFFPEHDQIDIYRKGASPSPAGSPLEAAAASQRPTEEAVWLAHELGHLQSKLRGNPSPPPNVAVEIYAEEVRAWVLGGRVLQNQGFVEWGTFDALRAQGLATYRRDWPLSDTELRIVTEMVTREVGA